MGQTLTVYYDAYICTHTYTYTFIHIPMSMGIGKGLKCTHPLFLVVTWREAAGRMGKELSFCFFIACIFWGWGSRMNLFVQQL
jgi:hypothetical protein